MNLNGGLGVIAELYDYLTKNNEIPYDDMDSVYKLDVKEVF